MPIDLLSEDNKNQPVDLFANDTPETISGFLNNAVPSAANLVTGTVKTLALLPKIAYQSITGNTATRDAQNEMFKQIPELIKQQLVSHYGSLDKIKQYAYEDPFGLAMDISTALMPFSKGLELIGGLSKVSELTKAGEIVGKISDITNPLSSGLKVTGMATKALSAPFKGSIDPNVVEIAGQMGIDLPASVISKNAGVQSVEAIAKKGFFGMSLYKKLETAHQKLLDYADNFANSISPDSDLTTGNKIIDGVMQYEDNWRKVKNELYKEADLSGHTIKTDVTATKTLLDDIIARKQASGLDTQGLAYFRKIRNEITPTKTDIVSVPIGTLDNSGKPLYKQVKKTTEVPLNAYDAELKLRDLNAKIRNWSDVVSTGNNGLLKQVGKSLSQDLDTTIRLYKPELQKAIDRADAVYQAGLDTLNSKWGKVVANSSSKPDLIVKTILNPKVSTEQVSQIMNTVGSEVIPSIQGSIINDILDKAKASDSGYFQPQGIAKQIKNWTPEKLQQILTPEQNKSLENISTISKAMGQGGKIASGSQTAFIGRILTELGIGGLTHNPLLALKLLVGDAAYSSFISSPVGQQWLTTGLKPMEQFGNALQQTAGTVGKTLSVSYYLNRMITPTQ